VVGRVLPGAAISLLIGNLFYARQARRLAGREGRADVTALPFGINTVSLAFVLFVMARRSRNGRRVPASRASRRAVAWQVGLVACLDLRIIEAAGGLIAAA